jgi:hypothetical protein
MLDLLCLVAPVAKFSKSDISGALESAFQAFLAIFLVSELHPKRGA